MKVKYFAWVRERIGKAEETVEPPESVRAPRRNISPSSLILLDEVVDAGAEIVVAGVDGDEGRGPQQG